MTDSALELRSVAAWLARRASGSAAAAFPVDSGRAGEHIAAMSRADAEDIRASLKGDGDAYARLVVRYQDEVARGMWRFTRDRAELEELVQDVFVEAYFSLSSYRAEGPFSHWLARIATRVGYRFWKRRSRKAAAKSLTAADVEAAASPANVDPGRAGELLDRLLGGLAPRDRLVLTLLYLEERSVAETAELTGWSETMVKVQAHRARKRLKALIERARPEE